MDEANTCIYVHYIKLYINYAFHSGRIRTLVAIETYSLHMLIMGKVEIDIFSVSMGIFEFLFFIC